MRTEHLQPKVLYLVGNKLDMARVNPHLRKVSRQEGERKAREIGAEYREISVREEEGLEFLEEAFERVLT
jgi:hypothetical protein